MNGARNEKSNKRAPHRKTDRGKPKQSRGRRPESHKPNGHRTKLKRRRTPVTFIVGLVFVMVIAYIVNAAVALSNKTEIPSVSVQMGSLDAPVILDGVIIRDEAVYSAPMSGEVAFKFNDLDKVKKGATVCEIYDEQAVAELTAGLDEINNAILKMQERRSDITAFKDDVDSINRQIKTIVDNKVIAMADFSVVFEVKEAIAQNLSLRNQILLNESRGSLSTLASDKQRYENELSKNFSSVYAEESGIISYIVDGLEESLNFETLDTVTPEQTRMTVDYGTLMRDRSVERDEAIFKILLSNEWYIASYIPMEHVFEWKEGQTRKVYLQQGTDFAGIDMKVEKLVKGEPDYYVLFKSTKNILDYIHMRDVKFKISNIEHKGYKIPSTAIVERTLLKVPNDYIISGDSTEIIKHSQLADEKIPVNTQGSDEDYTYISQEINSLVLHDTIKLPGEPYTIYEITEVLNVKGVYVINRGYAEFRRITIDPAMPISGDYVILEPEENRELRLHDRIISDAKSVYAEQRVVE